MSELSTYSIETDQLVFLAFKDGHSLRVSVAQLPRHLSPHDLAKVRRAIRLRRDFFRQNMPRVLVIGLAVLLAAAVMTTTAPALAHWWHPRTMPQSGPRTETKFVRSALPQSDLPSAVPTSPGRPVARATDHDADDGQVPALPPRRLPVPARVAGQPSPVVTPTIVAQADVPALPVNSLPAPVPQAPSPAGPSPAPVPTPGVPSAP